VSVGDSQAVISTYLPQIFARLRAAAGAGVPIIAMNYYNPFLPEVWFATRSVAALQESVAQINALNGLLESIYAAAGVPVADVENAFQVNDLSLVGGTPLNVLRECEWTWVCTPPPHGPHIHANTEGYGVIAEALEQVVP
jgi:hypothetical protein